MCIVYILYIKNSNLRNKILDRDTKVGYEINEHSSLHKNCAQKRRRFWQSTNTGLTQNLCHCEPPQEAWQSSLSRGGISGLLRCARNDDMRKS